ncbi:uncharacterized protein LOC130621400 [Hydractinia symbiolongicarpus]|uniref:uncharacterized protein LOC130621400 n=1 Tax=Hydractinia symbiolongicarpus TaxID=13093 RepID=UPI00254DB6C3|nr:uncharacterized protein LOC130621400 [Hydractinia symbiolongicarpus]
MFMKALGLVFVFIIQNVKLDLEFLESCKVNNVTPNFLNFRVANRNLRNSTAYRKCQLALLDDEIKTKRSRLRVLENTPEILKRSLSETLHYIDFLHITTLFLVSNDRSIKRCYDTQQKKLHKLGNNETEHVKVGHDPNKVIFNFSSYKLSDSEKSLLCKGLNFAIPPKKLEYASYLVPFELLMRDINRDDLSNEDKNYIKTRLKDTAFSSYYSYNSNPEKPSLPANEFKALQDLMNRDDIKHIVAVESLLDDDTKFAKLNIPPGKDINYIINIENRLRNSYRSLLNNSYIDETTYKKLCPSGSNPGVLYGLAKVHKPCVNGVPKFRPILSAIGTPTYKLANFLVPKLVSLTINDYTVKDSFSFASEIVQQNPNCYMASFDVNSLFPNIPLHETIDININEIESNCIDGIPKKDLKHLHTLATTESIFVFNGVYYKQIDGVAMGSPLGPTLANIFMCHYENIWLKNCPSEFKPIYYRRYVDDIFVLFESREHAQNFYEYINSRHQNIKFTFEEECDKVLPFLDVCVMREGDSFVTNVYRKPTFSGVYTNFSSFIPMENKHGLIFSLLYRFYHLCSDLNKFHVEISQLKTILGRNVYPSKVFEFCLRSFKSRNYEPKEQVSLAPKKELVLVLPFLGKITL